MPPKKELAEGPEVKEVKRRKYPTAKEQAQTRYNNLRADKLELEIAKTKRELISSELVRDFYVYAEKELTAILDASLVSALLPYEVPPAIIRKAREDALGTLESAWNRHLADSVGAADAA